MHDVMYGIAKTVTDSLRDADMQYTYAKVACDEGKNDIGIRHIEEAKRRLTGVKEWHDVGVKIMGDNSDPLAGVFLELIMQWHRELAEKIATFKPGT
ncbi:MAG: hypothetical protein IJ428_02880 [Clostridia bacterium]|nr:hypothetical protein [Clostridia bacterium]